MSKDLTKRYVEEVFDVTGLARRGIKRLDEIRNMPENEFDAFVKDLENRFRSHYERNLGKIGEALRRQKRQSKAFYYGSAVPLVTPGPDRSTAPIDSFLRKAALYHDKIIVEDPFVGTLSNRDGYTTEGLKRDIVLDMAGFLALQPWLEAGLVQPMPSFAVLEESLRERISGFADQDHDDEEWGSLKGALRNEDLGLEGEALIQVLEHLIKPIARQRIIVESGGARTAVLKLLLRGTSYTVGKGFFGAALTDSSPTTDMTYFWRLFGLWVSKRAHLLVQTGDLRREVWEWMRREVKAGRAWHQLKVEKLGALMKLAPEETIKIRGSSKYSLASFRRTLWRAVEEIELAKLGDEKEFQEVMSQVWRGVENEADDVERELKYLKLKAGASAAPTPLTLVLGFTPFPLNLLGMVLGGVQVTEFLRFLLERGKQKERSGYFLLKLREA